MSPNPPIAPEPVSRLRLLRFAILTLMGLLALRLFWLQAIEYWRHAESSRRTTLRAQPVDPPRGTLYDRNGVVLVDTEPAFTVTLTPVDFDTRQIPGLARLLGVPDSLLWARYRQARAYSLYRPSRLLRDLDARQFARLQENLYRFPGIDLQVETRRRYPAGVRGAHVFGYVREISAGELARRRPVYQMGDLIGHTGLERFYEAELRGQRGQHLVLVNALGQAIGPYREGGEDVPPQSGFDLELGLDANLQALAESLMTGRQGAVVAIDPQNGEILALVSSPDFDPKALTGVVDPSLWRDLNTDPARPLFNRAIQAEQPPGSTFKPFMALLALQEGIITPQTTVRCGGGFYFGRFFRCYGGAHGPVNAQRAVQVSCNTFFYWLMTRLNLQRWHWYGRQFGFGRPTGIDLPGERGGVLPDSAYFNRLYGPGRWTMGYLISLGIGQGNLTVTPLQMAAYCAALANGGWYYTPHVVRRMRNPQTGQERLWREAPRRIPIDSTYIALIREGMRLAVEAGTGRAARVPGIAVAGKTGTAQNPHGRDHAWFIGFAPFEKPRIAVAVLVENAGFGGVHAAPIARALFERYLRTRSVRPQTVSRPLSLR
ncbi:MAG: penicillin-binding protein 2 [Bacteroidota bacterium]|nr:penicillin-binding protein 2 [Bacteroidota bacterium]MDW8137800.1 penicillin-binding protein 2 [Bacteroidota bacterium]